MTDKLDEVYEDCHIAGFIEMLIHEQYFYSDYSGYMPEYENIVVGAAKWCHEHGYTGSLLNEVMFEGHRSCDAPTEAQA